jgi:hypothetical protein
MIGGFIIGGEDPTKVVIRAIGPSLSEQNVPNSLSDPLLELYDGNGSLIFTNDNWRTTQEQEILATGVAPSQDSESAIVATLCSGRLHRDGARRRPGQRRCPGGGLQPRGQLARSAMFGSKGRASAVSADFELRSHAQDHASRTAHATHGVRQAP